MLQGQWTGWYAGTTSGNVIVEFDEFRGQLVGSVLVYNHDARNPATFAWLEMPLGLKEQDRRVPLFYIDASTGGEPVEAARIAGNYPAATWPQYADTKWRLSSDRLYVSWTLDVGGHGLAVLSQGHPSGPSERKANPDVTNWSEFKEYASTLEPDRFLFRGHSDNKWRLRTHFHRTGRANLRRFMTDDVEQLHRHLSGLTTHFFNLTNPIENGAFYALAQHHGYPTPLLDWTKSPFVAAYFAYRTLPKSRRGEDDRVRIIKFDARAWRMHFRQLSILAPANRHLSLLAPLGINNTRIVPQQAFLTVSNIDDIESYIAECEEMRATTFLEVIDLPGSERHRVMNELALMGITAGSMFPGLDGACEQLREQNFEL